MRKLVFSALAVLMLITACKHQIVYLQPVSGDVVAPPTKDLLAANLQSSLTF